MRVQVCESNLMSMLSFHFITFLFQHEAVLSDLRENDETHRPYVQA